MNWSRGLSETPGSRYVRPLTVAAASVAACSAAVVWKRQELLSFRPRLNNTVIEAVSGAVGEVAQIALLYPLDTIKVRCQANSCSTAATLAQVAAQSKGNLLAALALLYAGAIPAAATSILVGSVHYVCFCATKRAVLNLPGFSSSSSSTSSTPSSSSTSTTTPSKNSTEAAATATIAAVTPAASAAAAVSGDEEEEQHSTTTIIMSHGLTGSHFHLVEECEPDTEQQQQQQQQQEAAPLAGSTNSTSSAAAHDASASAAASATSAAAVAATSSEEGAAADADGRMAANVLSAILTAAITALVEAPLELFRHNSQAGQCQANFVAEMWRSMRKDGPKSLYYGFLPYCFEAWPYDITELLVVGGLKDSRAELAGKPGLLGAAVAAAPPQLYDLSVGAVAGTAAVLISMPFDCVKTYMQTHGQALGGSSSSSVGGFWATGRDMVARKGPGALYVGLLPRLMHQVPGAMVCWWAIEGCHRHLQQFHHSYAAPEAAAAS